MSFSPLHHGRNDLDIHTVKAPKSKVNFNVPTYLLESYVGFNQQAMPKKLLTYLLLIVNLIMLSTFTLLQAKLVVCAYKAQLTMPPD